MNKQAIAKRIIGLLTAMLTVSIAVPAYTQEQGPARPTIVRPTITPALIKEIKDADDLAAFRDAVNGGATYINEEVKLMANIEVPKWNEAIGNDFKPFNGTFQGNGYVIKIEDATTSLFGNLGNASNTNVSTVKYLGVDAAMRGGENTGVITMKNYGTIQYCFVKGSITYPQKYPGGIAGQNNGTIADCYSTLSITVDKGTYAGGMVGYNSGSIQRCYVTGGINNASTSFSTGAGGIVGSNANNGTIQNCIALNTGITGKVTGRIVASNYNQNNACTYNYASPLIPGAWSNKGADQKDGADLTDENFTNVTTATEAFNGWSTDTWELATANLPTLKGFKGEQPVKDITRESVITKPLLTTITSADNLAAFRDAVNGGETYEGKTVTLANDITVTDWTEGIGSSNSNPFLGAFDGAGYKITLAGSASLFKRIGSTTNSNAIVKNLAVHATIEATANAAMGGIAGLSFGTIQNCYTEGSITSTTHNVGGIVGSNSNTIQNCYSTALCTAAAAAAGGIAGYNTKNIRQCYATGAITGKSVGGIAGSLSASPAIENCIALNTSITATATDGSKSGRIMSSNFGTHTGNYASPIIPGTWTDKGGSKKDGDDLTEENFLANAVGSVFGDWTDQSCWSFGGTTNLPKLKTIGLTLNRVIDGQADPMPARAGFLEKVIEISAPVTYDEATHKGKPIRVLDKGIFTVNTDGASLKKLTIEEGGQVVADKAFNVKELVAPITFGNKWRTCGYSQDIRVNVPSGAILYWMYGYKSAKPDDQLWKDVMSQVVGPKKVISRNSLMATEAELTTTLTLANNEGEPATIPADVAAPTGETLNTGIFLFYANPTLKNVTIPVAYILSADGTRFERTENAVVKPFQSYVVANAATANAVMSLRAGGIPTANEPIALPDNGFRLWGSNGQLHLAADTPSDVAIYDLSGRLIRRITLNGAQTLTLGSGIYLVHSNNITYKVSL